MQVTVIGSSKKQPQQQKKICTDTRHQLQVGWWVWFRLLGRKMNRYQILESRFSNRERTQIRLAVLRSCGATLRCPFFSHKIWPERFETRAARVDSASDEREIRDPARRYFLWPRNVTVGNRSSSNISSSSTTTTRQQQRRQQPQPQQQQQQKTQHKKAQKDRGHASRRKSSHARARGTLSHTHTYTQTAQNSKTATPTAAAQRAFFTLTSKYLGFFLKIIFKQI